MITFFTKIKPRLTTALLALYQGAPSEISKFFMNDPDFLQYIAELNDYHALNFPCNQPSVTVLSVYTSDLLRDLQDPFLFQFTVPPSAFSISRFLREFFKNSKTKFVKIFSAINVSFVQFLLVLLYFEIYLLIFYLKFPLLIFTRARH